MMHFTIEERIAIVAGGVAIFAILAAILSCKWAHRLHRFWNCRHVDNQISGEMTEKALPDKLDLDNRLIHFKDLLPLVPSLQVTENDEKPAGINAQNHRFCSMIKEDDVTTTPDSTQRQTRESRSSASSTASSELSPPSHQLLLFLRESSSTSTATSDCDSGISLCNRARIEFGLEYDCAREKLIIVLLRASRIPPNIYGGASDTYVQVIVGKDNRSYWSRISDTAYDTSSHPGSPDSRASSPNNQTTNNGYNKVAEFQTRVVRKETEPLFREQFVVEGLKKKEQKKTWVKFVLHSIDRFCHHNIVGTKLIDIDRCIMDDSETLQVSMEPYAPKLGEITLCLCYMPTAGRLVAKVTKIANLKPPNGLTTANPYVKGIILRRGKVLEKHVTSSRMRDLNPTFTDEPLVYDIPTWELEKIVLLITVFHDDASFIDARLGVNPGKIQRRRSRSASLDEQSVPSGRQMHKSLSSNHMPRRNSIALGRLALGSLAVIDASSRRHWAEVIANPRKYIPRTHKLRP